MSVQTEIGKLIEGPQERDAIHIAVAPVVAAEKLSPGQDIGFVSADGETVGVCTAAIGIVDPFLQGRVLKGDHFWMFLFPNTITSLKHNWTHPAFEKASPTPTPKLDAKATSEAWLREFCAKGDCPKYETVMTAVLGESINNGDSDYYSTRMDDEYLHFGGLDAHGEIPDEFWDHVEVVTGRKFRERPTYFSCSC